MELQTLDKCSEIIARMQELVPPGSPAPQAPELLQQLEGLTQALIRSYQASGRLQGDPFNDAWTRPLYLYESEVRNYLQGKTVVVTGGEGCVGDRLIHTLLKLGVNRIVSIDNARCDQDQSLQPTVGAAENVALYVADVRDFTALQHIFTVERPQIVFHLAAIRIPGLAEKIVRETISSNILGTQNIIQLCESFGVEQCIFSSTGKASRYWTGEVYAATKKVNEWLFAQAAQEGTVRYGMVRFTHMLDNSSMCEQIGRKVAAGEPVNIHAPERYVVGQNVGEAVHLLLNALVFSERDRLRFLLVRNLGWPTESLEVALYEILRSGKTLPIYFQGTPPGYEESFFLGQVDWDNQTEINTLVNMLETRAFSEITSSNDMILSEVVPFDMTTLTVQLEQLKTLCLDETVAPATLKQTLAEVVRAIASTAFDQAPTNRVLQLLLWGLNLKRYERGEFDLSPYQPFIELAVRSLSHRLDRQALDECHLSLAGFEQMLSALSTLPSLQNEVAQMRKVLQPSETVTLFRSNRAA